MTGLKLAFGFLVLCSGIGVLVSGVEALQTPEKLAPSVTLVMGGSGPFWQLAAAGAREAADRNGVNLRVEMPEHEGSSAEQMAILDRLANAQPHGVAVCPADHAAQMAFIDQLAAKTRLMTFLADAPQAGQLFHVGASDYSAAWKCASAIGSMGERETILALVPKDAGGAIAERLRGLEESLRMQVDGDGRTMFSRMHVIEYEVAVQGGAKASAAAALRTALNAYPHATWVVSLASSGAAALVDVLVGAGKLGQVRLVTFDQSEETLAAIEAGRIHAAVAQDPFELGYTAVNWLACLCRSNELGLPSPGKGQANIRPQIVHRENVAQFRAHQLIHRAPPHG